MPVAPAESIQEFLRLGEMYRQQGELQEASVCFLQALLQDPSVPDVHFHLGNVLHDLGRLEEAIASFRQATALRPDYALAHFNLGSALRDTGRDRWAITILNDGDKLEMVHFVGGGSSRELL